MESLNECRKKFMAVLSDHLECTTGCSRANRLDTGLLHRNLHFVRFRLRSANHKRGARTTKSSFLELDERMRANGKSVRHLGL